MFRISNSKISHTNAELVCIPSCSGVNLKKKKNWINGTENKIFQVVNASIYFFVVNTLFILEEKSNWTHWKNIYTNMTKSTNTSFSFIHSTVLHIWDFFMHFYESLILLIQRYLSREKQLTYCMFPVPLQLWGCMWQMPWLKKPQYL